MLQPDPIAQPPTEPTASAGAAAVAPAPGSRRRLRRAVAVVAVLGLVGAAFGAGAGADRLGILGAHSPAASTAPAAGSAQFDLIRQAWDLLHTQYVGRSGLDDPKLAYAAIDALTTAVGDTGHTSFERPSDLATEAAALNGSYVGIGAELDTDTAGPMIVGVFDGSPAAGAGLGPGDRIVAVDGRGIAGLTLSDLSSHIRGPAGTSVSLTVRTAGGATRTVRLVRAKVTIPSVEWAMVPGTRVADVRIEQFSKGADDALVAALRAAEAAGARGVILDLRHDPGGLVDEATGVASQFVASGLVYESEDASGTVTPVPVRQGGIATDLPIVVLVDQYTASASEIVAGALQDARRATVVGETTFGTGTVLAEFTLADGSALRIGTVQWLTPAGRQIWHHGITPDVTVSLASGATLLLPGDLARLGRDGLTRSGDAQLLAALRLLAGAA